MFNIANTLKVNFAGISYMFGRMLINGQYVLGRVFADQVVKGFQSYGTNGTVIASGFDVLICDITPPCRRCSFYFFIK